MYIQLKAQYFSTNKQFPLHIKGHICVQFPYGKKYYIYLIDLKRYPINKVKLSQIQAIKKTMFRFYQIIFNKIT